jgi:hypothetical protein
VLSSQFAHDSAEMPMPSPIIVGNSLTTRPLSIHRRSLDRLRLAVIRRPVFPPVPIARTASVAFRAAAGDPAAPIRLIW